MEIQRECTPQEGQTWHDRYSVGYRLGRDDLIIRRTVRESWLIEIPAELPGENGAQYVARHVEIARQIGYTGAVKWYLDQGYTYDRTEPPTADDEDKLPETDQAPTS
jgi:hypothetical protein